MAIFFKMSFRSGALPVISPLISGVPFASVLPVIIWPKGIMPLVAGSRYQHHWPSSIIQ